MSEMDLERPVDDSVEQNQDVIPGDEELDEIYDFVTPEDQAVVYCRIGERSSHTWFVLTHLLGKPGVRNYDGSWTEWGNAVRVPIVAGEAPGVVPV